MDDQDFNEMPKWDFFEKFRGDEGEEWKHREKLQRAQNLYNAGRQLYITSKIFCETLKGEVAESVKELLMQNAIMICPKIVGAEGGNLYILKMENASIIRTNCRELLVQVFTAEMHDLCEEAYLELIRNDMEQFKSLFIIWVSGFEKDDIEDDWGLY